MSQETIGKVVRLFSKVDGALKKCSSIVTLLFVLGAIWAAGLWSPIVNEVKHGGERPSFSEERKGVRTEVRNIIEKGQIAGLTQEQIQKAAQEYNDYPIEKSAERSRKAFLSKVHSMGAAGTLLAFLKWLLVFYSRSLLVATLFYLLQMARRRGILATILADKKRFLLAIIAWPIMIFRYPYNMVREIIVTAELRRMGSAFRKLTKSERELVCRVAETDKRQFQNWHADFRLVHAKSFRRGFALALLATIVVMLIAPVARCSVETRHGVSNVIMANAPPGSSSLVSVDQADEGTSASAIIAPETLLVIPLALKFFIEPLCEKLITGPIRDIIPIPKITPVFVLR